MKQRHNLLLSWGLSNADGGKKLRGLMLVEILQGSETLRVRVRVSSTIEYFLIHECVGLCVCV